MSAIVRDIVLLALAALTLLKVSDLKVSDNDTSGRAFAERSARRVAMLGAKIGILLFSVITMIDIAREFRS